MRFLSVYVIAMLALCQSAIGRSRPLQTSTCQTYVGHTVAPVSFEVAIRPFLNLPTKSEFESTTAFIAKISALTPHLSEELVVLHAPLRSDDLNYNADHRRLTVYGRAFEWAGFNGKVSVMMAGPDLDWGFSSIEAAISVVEIPDGSYSAQNGFGEKFRVESVDRKIQAIFEPRKSFQTGGLFTQGNEFVVDTISMDPSLAEKTKSQLRTAFVITREYPFLIEYENSAHDATPDNPLQIEQSESIMVAKFHCGLLLDGANSVVRSYPTR